MKKPNKNWWILIPALLGAALILLAIFLPDGGKTPADPADPLEGAASSGAIVSSEAAVSSEAVSERPSGKPSGIPSGESSEVTPDEPSDESSDKESGGIDLPSEEPAKPVELAESYELRAAAAAVMMLTLQDPTMQVKKLLLPAVLTLPDAPGKEGVWLLTSGLDGEKAYHITPLRAQRKEKGSMDLSEAKLGLAALDPVEVSKLPAGKAEADTAALKEAMSQLSMPTLYEH